MGFRHEKVNSDPCINRIGILFSHFFRIFNVQITKRDADVFGSDDHPIPPSCLITVFAVQAEDTEEHLNYAVSLKGVDSDAQKIYIDRFLEKGKTYMCYQNYNNYCHFHRNCNQ